MDFKRFKYLQQHYLAGTATRDEIGEFRMLLASEKYEAVVRKDLADFLKEELTKPDQEVTGIDENVLFDSIMERVRPPFAKVKTNIFRERIWYAAAMILLGLGLAWYLLPSPLKSDQTALFQQAQQADTMFVFRQKDYIHLPDGSTVLLNEGSELSYSQSFGNGSRTVRLNGEAYFDIKKDPMHPFIVESGKVKTRVLGTAFNVNAYGDKVVVTVTRGLVEVGDDQQVFAKIKPDEQITVNTTKNDFVMQPVKADAALEWKKENLILDGISLLEAAELISQKFGVKVKVDNDSIKKCRISAWFLHGEDMVTILDLVTGTRQATYTLEKNQVVISGGIGCE
jgi:transmembrane sensor